MPDLTDDEQKQILGEVMSDQLKVILEHLEALSDVPKDVKVLKEDVETIKTDVKVIKVVTKDQSRQLDSHEQRIATLETV